MLGPSPSLKANPGWQVPRSQLPSSQHLMMPWGHAAGEAWGCRQRVTPVLCCRECSLLCTVNHLPALHLCFSLRPGAGRFGLEGFQPPRRPSPRPSPLHFGSSICCVLLFGGSPCRAGKAAQCRQEEEEEEGWGEASPELCQMWERRKQGGR